MWFSTFDNMKTKPKSQMCLFLTVFLKLLIVNCKLIYSPGSISSVLISHYRMLIRYFLTKNLTGEQPYKLILSIIKKTEKVKFDVVSCS